MNRALWGKIYFNAVFGGLGGLLTFVGAPGSGKTALAEAAADQARRRGFGVLRG